MTKNSLCSKLSIYVPNCPTGTLPCNTRKVLHAGNTESPPRPERYFTMDEANDVLKQWLTRPNGKKDWVKRLHEANDFLKNLPGVELVVVIDRALDKKYFQIQADNGHQQQKDNCEQFEVPVEPAEPTKTAIASPEANPESEDEHDSFTEVAAVLTAMQPDDVGSDEVGSDELPVPEITAPEVNHVEIQKKQPTEVSTAVTADMVPEIIDVDSFVLPNNGKVRPVAKYI